MKQRFKSPGFWMLVGGNIAYIIGCFLPLFGGPLSFASFFDLGGKYVLILNVIALLWAYWEPKYALLLNILSTFIVSFILVFSFKGSFVFFSRDIGNYLVLIGNIVAVIGGIKDKRQQKLTYNRKNANCEGEHKYESKI